ncbi:MAG TPA: amidohydrolase family protein [Acidimicrobiia bacterium]|jgi:predicted TIM-barrel fold metal-dependent hydrolase|nr:amidohydrolase family protein [Acidimicrobiia bacterium]
MTDIPWIVSLDDHVVEPPDVWTKRLPAKYRDVGPHIVMAPPGTPVLDGGTYREAPGTEGDPVAWWFYEDQQYSVKRLIAAAGYPAEEIGFDAITFDQMRPGCWQPQARLDDMTMNHVEASLAFPNYPRFCGQIFLKGEDKELARLCVEAYNDWQVEEWCAGSGGRLIPLCLIPLWDVELAAAEVRRNAARGVRAVAFSELPPWLGLPSIHSGYWDPFFAACAETDTVVAMHIGSGTKTINSSDDAPDAVQAVNMFANSALSLIDFLFSGVLVRFPRLKLLYAEAQIGWIPYVLERVDDVWDVHRGWSQSQRNVSEPPSQYYYRQVVSCFFKDGVGVENLDRVGRDNIAFETDYPHQDSTWPNTHQVAKELFGHLDAETVHKIVRGNAIRFLGLEGLGDGTAPRSA